MPMEQDELVAKVDELFKKVYNQLYTGGNIDQLADAVEKSGDVVEPVSSMVSVILTKVAKMEDVTNINVILGLAIMVISDILATLTDLGIEVSEDIMPKIMKMTTEMVLQASPEIADMLENSPEGQQLLREMQANQPPAGGQPPMQPQAPGPSADAVPVAAPPAPGVMGGAV